MITRFQATGASAGTAKCSNELSIPTTRPERASSTTIGNISRARLTVRSLSAGSSSKPGANRLMSGSANRMNSAVTAAEHQADQEEQARGDPEGLLALALLEQLGEDRHERALERRVGEQRAHEVRHLEGDRERRHRAGDAEVAGRDDLAGQPEQARQAGREREERGVARQAPCVSGPVRVRRSPLGGARYTRVGSMANIASQEKRIHRAERERLENRRRTSQVKTWFRRLESGGGRRRRRDGPTTSSATSCRGSTGPSKSGALHRNNGARKKSRAARIRSRLS